MKRAWIYLFLFAVLAAIGTTEAVAAVVVEDVDLGGTPLHALGRYRYRDDLPFSPIATLAIHRTSDYRNHASTTNLANRGFATLGIRTRFGNSEAAVDFEQIALDVRNGIRFLKSKGHTKIILIGHSGGGPTTSYFQALAENGPSYCQGKNKITECPFTGAEFTPADKADGIVFVDAHPGIGVNQLRSLNASVVNENQPFGPATNPTLDPFDPAHGYNGLPPVHEPDGDSIYSDHFVDTYAQGQSRRMNGLIQEAQLIKKKIALGLIGTTDPNDLTQHPFPIFRANARMVQLSTEVQCCTQNDTRLLQDSTGTLSAPQTIHTVRVPQPNIKDDDEDPNTFENLSLTSFLSANAIRSKHSLDESKIDWCSTNNSTPCAVAHISVPILVMVMQGHYFIRDGEYIYESSASIDKQIVAVEGATHGLGNCTACAAYHNIGPYNNVSSNLWNYVAAWANTPGRF
jgi:pimeloyl-ACP methyl ester carboxylesterase